MLHLAANFPHISDPLAGLGTFDWGYECFVMVIAAVVAVALCLNRLEDPPFL